MRRCLLLLCFVVAMPLIATGCQAGEKGTRVAVDASSRNIILNPTPKQVVKLHGRVPPSLRFEFWVRYSMDDVKSEGCRPRDTTGGFLPMLGDFTRVETLAPRYLEGNRYETELVVDKYLPGPCGWAFDEIKAVVVKDGRVGDRLYTTETTSPVVDNNTDGKFEVHCTQFDHHSCAFRQNADSGPVMVLCEMFQSIRANRSPSLYCSEQYGSRYKQTHLLNHDTRGITIDFYDLAQETSPVAPKTPVTGAQQP
jgi:hypothetical protein